MLGWLSPCCAVHPHVLPESYGHRIVGEPVIVMSATAPECGHLSLFEVERVAHALRAILSPEAST